MRRIQSCVCPPRANGHVVKIRKKVPVPIFADEIKVEIKQYFMVGKTCSEFLGYTRDVRK